MRPQIKRPAERDHAASHAVQPLAAIRDGHYRWQFVRYHHERGAQCVAQFQDQLVQPGRGHRV